MSYLGDIRLGDTIDTKFVTTAATTGAPTTLAGTPVISAYVGNSTTQLTAGITLTVDFDGVTGLHNVRVVASGANGYATASNYQLVITTGTVGGTSAVGYVIGEFSIEARSAVMPTVAARTLDVTATGAAGVDWANVEAPTTTLALTGTTIATTQKVDVETIKTNPVVNAGTVTFPTTATLASTTNITAATGIVLSGVTHTGAVIPTVTTTTTATNLTTNNDKTGYGLSATAVQAIWDALTTALTTVGSIGKKLADWTIGTAQTGDSFARLGAPAGASVSADLAAVKVDTAAILVDTAEIGAAGAGLTALAPAAILTTALTESYAADGAAPTLAQAIFLIQQSIGDFSISGTTLTVKKLDGTTAAATYTLDDATNPTSRTRAT